MAKQGAPTLSWGGLLATTIMEYIDSGMLRDQVHKKSPLWKWLREGGRIKKLSGGERIRVPQMFEGSGNYKRYSGNEALDPSPYDGQTNAFFDWKQAATTYVLSGLDKRSNQGENRIRELAKDRMFQAEATLADNLATDAYSDGTADGSKQITGLAAMLATTITSGTYATINFGNGNNETWRNNVITTVGNPATNLLPNLRTAYNDATEIAGVDGEPDAVFTTQTLAETLEALVVPAIRYVGGEEADLSAKPRYRNAKIFWEAKCQAGTVYILNSRHIFMFVHQDANLSLSEAGVQMPVNQDTFIAPILFQGNMATNLRAGLSKLTGVS
jgi:hypothetical protein